MLTLLLCVSFAGWSQITGNFFVNFTDSIHNAASKIAGKTPEFTNGHLLYTTEAVRHDYEYGFSDAAGDSSFMLNASTDVYFAVKAFGAFSPNIDLDTAEGEQHALQFYFNNISASPSEYGGNSTITEVSFSNTFKLSKFKTDAGNEVIYFKITDGGNEVWNEWDSLAQNGTAVDLYAHRIELKFIGNEPFGLNLDWVGTFSSVAEIEAMAIGKDDGENDPDEDLDSNARLSELTYDGVSVPDFNENKYSYDVRLPEGTSTPPTVAAVASNASATINITQSGSLPGTAEVVVTSPNQAITLTYFVNFSVNEKSPQFFDSFTTGEGDLARIERGKGTYENGHFNWTGAEDTRHDFEYGFEDGSTESFVINPYTDNYFAVKFAGDFPTTFDIDTAGGGHDIQFYMEFAAPGNAAGAGNGASTDMKTGKTDEFIIHTFITEKGNRVMYWKIVDTDAAEPWATWKAQATEGVGNGDEISAYDIASNRLEFKLVAAEAWTGIHLDWIGTFTTEEDIQLAAVTRDDGNDDRDDYTPNTLSDLTVDGTTVEGFDSTVVNYDLVLPFGTTTIPTVAGTALASESTVEINQATELPGTATVVVSGYDLGAATSNTYSVNFTVAAPSDDATLASMTIDGAAYAGFDAAVLEYDTTLAFGTTTVPTIAANAAHEGATVVVTEAQSLPGTTTVEVTAEDGQTKKTYSVNFKVAEKASDDATLASLSIDGNAYPGFAAATLTYDTTLAYGTTVVPTITAAANHVKASIEVNAATELPGSTTVVVTAQDGSTQTYTVNFKIADPSTDATLASLTVDGEAVAGFDAATLSYEVTLAYGTTVVPTVAATANDANATVEITAATSLPGATTVVVTAQDGSTASTYTVDFKVEAPATDATLADLTVDGTTITGFDAATLSYELELATGTTTVPTVAATATDANATVEITAATSLPGATTIVVTAQDGSTTQTYAVNFTLEPLSTPHVELAVYPNPTVGIVTLTGVQNVNEVRIINLGGLEITKPVINQQIDVTDLEAGVYFINIENLAAIRLVKH
ncbi:T9SS type A sorting domain-containing protein [Marinoscillum furvescens]|uniref:Putative secreted protein (Por secretion system target) n=1 Tax=Marinoscillum furvescens DSM 4134 TaxID=1122208 RepID=A0A3D9L401_MARFU|nr:T9SS type A sorting domain-containing protein [Marinoscillum furvescens]RED98418.1 putative secreted protein (Por secretion system target) [Marinoscillum furvescens DSM 4134]